MWSVIAVAFLLVGNVAAVDDESDTVANQFKAPHDGTPPVVAEQWAADDAALQAYIAQHVPAVLEHTGAVAFDEHLRGVQAVLRHWGVQPHVATAGLLHSIYGTEGFQGFALPLSERPVLQDLIGKEAEFLCWVFCMVDRWTFDQTVFAWQQQPNNQQPLLLLHDEETANITFWARPELGRFPIDLTPTQWLDFIELSLADWMEQVEGAARKTSSMWNWNHVGDAYAYRRTSFAQMSRILQAQTDRPSSVVASRMHAAVMATDSNTTTTRQLVQRRTPPLSKATAAAHNALRAAGYSLPLTDFQLMPMTAPEVVDLQACLA